MFRIVPRPSIYRFYSTNSPPVAATSKFSSLLEKGKSTYLQIRKGFNDLMDNIIKANQLNDEIKKNNYIPTRREFKFLHLVAIDKSKLIKFGAISLILPEILPFLYKLGFDLAPSTFQNKESRVKDIYQYRLTANYTPLKELLNLISAHEESLTALCQSRPEYFLLHNLKSNQVKLINGFLGLPTRGLNLHSKLEAHLNFICKDDEILYKKGLEELEVEELDEALFERGMSPKSFTTLIDKKKALGDWILLHYEQRLSPLLLILNQIEKFKFI